MKKNIAKRISPEFEYYQQGFDFAHKQAAFKSKNQKVPKKTEKKLSAFQFKSQKVLNTVPSSPRKLFLGQYEFMSLKKKCFFSKNKNSNSGQKSHDRFKAVKSKPKEIQNQHSPAQMERKYENTIKLPHNLIKPTLLSPKQNIQNKSKSTHKAFEKFMKEYAATVRVTNPETSRQKFIKKNNKEKRAVYRTESLAGLSRKYGMTETLTKRSTDCSNKDSNTGESTASHLSSRKREQKSNQKVDQTLISKLKIQETDQVGKMEEDEKQLEEEGYGYIEEIMEKLKVLALYSQGIVESYEELDEWEELIFLVYKKYYLERKKLFFALKTRDIKYFSSFFENQTSCLKKIWKFVKSKNIYQLLVKVEDENQTILASLRNLYNLAIEKSGIFVNMNQEDNFHKQMFKLLSEQVESLEILFEQNKEEVTTRLRKNLECAKTLCQIGGMEQWKVFSILSSKQIKKTLFWKILQYYGTLL